jgi:hypothetical protein
MCSQVCSSLLRLRVVADADPSALARVLAVFQNLNVVPRRVLAEFDTNDILHIEVDVFGMPEEQLRLITGKIRQAPSVVNAHPSRFLDCRSISCGECARPRRREPTSDPMPMDASRVRFRTSGKGWSQHTDQKDVRHCVEECQGASRRRVGARAWDCSATGI